MTGAELYRRGAATLIASWEEYAREARGSAVYRLPGVAAAVFPNEPERGVYNNALIDRGLGPSERTRALEALKSAYAAAGVDRFAAWVHESDAALRADVERRGYTLDESTRAMGMTLAGLRMPRPELELGAPDWPRYLSTFGLPAGLLGEGDHAAFHVLVARRDGEDVATAMAFDHDGDCGIYNVATLERSRRRGLGTALTALHLHRAVDRGCRTASVQSTLMAEHVYAAVGFRDLGRFLEYVPG
jgi:ribosomal protein S18 acetylase RimI-like enzyme